MYLFSIKLLKSSENTETRASQLPEQRCESFMSKNTFFIITSFVLTTCPQKSQFLLTIYSNRSMRVHSTLNSIFFVCVCVYGGWMGGEGCHEARASSLEGGEAAAECLWPLCWVRESEHEVSSPGSAVAGLWIWPGKREATTLRLLASWFIGLPA